MRPRLFAHVERRTEMFAKKAGRLIGYSNGTKSYRVNSAAARRIMGSRDVAFIETLSHLITLPRKPQLLVHPHRPSGEEPGGIEDYNNATDGVFLLALCDYTSLLAPCSDRRRQHFPEPRQLAIYTSVL